MIKDYLLLDWENLKKRLSSFIKTKSTEEKLSELEPSFDLERSQKLKSQSLFIWERMERREKIEIPFLVSLSNLFKKAKLRELFLPQEIYDLALWIKTALSLEKLVKDSPFASLLDLSKELSFLYERIKEVFDLERKEVKTSATYQLALIRRKRELLEGTLFERLDYLRERFYKLGYLQEDLYLQKEGRWVLPVRLEFKNKVKGAVRGFSQSGATIFIEPLGIITLANELEEVLWEEEREIKKILKELSSLIFFYEKTFRELEAEIVELDLAIAKVELGRLYRGVFPEEGSTKIIIEEGYHPLLFFKRLKKGSPLPVKNNYYLEQGLLITGPNLGGKTVTLKTIGLMVFMAQSGFLLPAKRALLPYFKKVLVDLGDEQNLWEGESSFSSCLKNLKRIWESADSETLVLLDEPGRGTNPEEGSALVWAIIEKFWERGSKILITTHSHLLKILAKERANFSIATMEFDRKNYRPTYGLCYGYWGESHAFDLAKKVKFPDDLLNLAKGLLKEKEYFNLQERYLQSIEDLEMMKRLWEEKIKLLEKEKETLEKEKKKLKEKYDRKFRELLENWQREFQEFLKGLPKEISYKKALKEFDSFLKKREFKPFLEERDFKEGEKVYIKRLSKEGRILNLKETSALVICGNIKIELPLWELEKRESKEGLSAYSKEKGRMDFLNFSKEKLYLRGEDVESALYILEKKLNECFLKERRYLLVIHGQGTGRLRQAIREYLKGHPLIENFESASPSEGGSGATLVYLYPKN